MLTTVTPSPLSPFQLYYFNIHQLYFTDNEMLPFFNTCFFYLTNVWHQLLSKHLWRTTVSCGQLHFFLLIWLCSFLSVCVWVVFVELEAIPAPDVNTNSGLVIQESHFITYSQSAPAWNYSLCFVALRVISFYFVYLNNTEEQPRVQQ